MRRLLLILTLVIVPAVSAGAQTLTTRDIIELTKAGLTEPVLLALIEVNRSVFPVDRETLTMLKDAGVPPNVIVAMVRSGRDPVVPPPPPPAPIIVRHEDVEETSARERELQRELDRSRARERELERSRSSSSWRGSQQVVPVAVPVYVPVPVQRREPPKPKEPVYWGWDGKLRPDAWKPAETTRQPDPAKPPKGGGE